MKYKDINSEENSISESIEAQFDDLFAPKKIDELSDAVKKPSAPDIPTAKKAPNNTTPQKSLNKKESPNKAPVSEKEPSTSSAPSVKVDPEKITPDKTLIGKRTLPVQSDKKKPAVKEDTSVTRKEVSTEDTSKTTVQNIFKKANEEYKKNILWEKVKQGLNPLIFTLLILLLVMLSMVTGMVMGSDGMFGFFNMKNSSTFTLKPVSSSRTNNRKVITSKNIKSPSPEENIEETKIAKSRIKDPETIEKEVVSQGITDTILPVKTADESTDAVKEEFLTYPYSVYLGSYNSIEKVEKTSSKYTVTGITSYWIKLDLGEKGVWYRHFVGYFQSREEADEFIKARQLKGAESKITKYANLIGIYRSKEDIDRKKARLEEQGYSPYIICDSENVYRLYIGAFYQKSRAEELKNDLEVNGIVSELIER